MTCPTLLIVGSSDHTVLRLNRDAFEQMKNVKKKELSVVQGATHLFEEPGKLEEVAALASSWFKTYLNVPFSSEA